MISRQHSLSGAELSPQVDFDGYCGEKVVVLETLDEQVLLQDLIPYILQSEEHFKYALRTASGSTNKFTSWRKIAAYEFFLPPLEQQLKIVELMHGFEKAIEAIADSENHAELLARNLSSVLLWQNDSSSLRRLGDCLSSEPESGISSNAAATSTGYSILTLTALGTRGFIPLQTKPLTEEAFMESKSVKTGDLLISRANVRERVGLAGIVTELHEPTMFSDLMMRLETDRSLMLPKFLLFVLLSEKGRESLVRIAASSTASMLKINKRNLKEIQIPLLPLSEQYNIVNRLDLAFAAVEHLDQHQRHLRALRSTILNVALTPSTTVPALVTA